MARIGTACLDTDSMFPKMEFQLIYGEKLKLPDGMGQGYSVVLTGPRINIGSQRQLEDDLPDGPVYLDLSVLIHRDMATTEFR